MGITERVAGILEEIETARSRRGSGEEVRLMAAVKEREPSEIEEAVRAGIRFIGENRVQQAEEHAAGTDPKTMEGCRRHFIGRLQSNKVLKAVGLFDCIDSVDSEGLARKIGAAAEKLAVPTEVMVEVNMGEAQKGGVPAGGALRLCEVINSDPRLSLVGLMGVPPYFDDPEGSRPFFAELYKLFRRVKEGHARPANFKYLSMGMSGDFRVAIEEGATMIRIGTDIFGPRRPK